MSKDSLYKGPINKEYLKFFGMTEEQATGDFSALMAPMCMNVSNKMLEIMKKQGYCCSYCRLAVRCSQPPPLVL